MNADYAALGRGLLPEALLLLTALMVMTADLAGGRRRDATRRLQAAAGLGALGVLAALAAVPFAPSSPAFGGVLAFDPAALVGRAAVLVFLLVVLGTAAGGRPLRQPAEFVGLLLFSGCGLLLLCSARQLMLGFVALELASLPLYALAGFDRSRPESAEAGMKYFLFGGTAAAFLLLGFSLAYGATGSLDIAGTAALWARPGGGSLALAAAGLILVGVGFKTAAAPFHFWAPDVYQGAPASAVSLIASGSKLAGWIFFARVLIPRWGGLAGSAADGLPAWAPAGAAVVAASILLGNLAALAQSNVRRLLAYSAVSHAGALLLGVLATGRSGPGPVVYYAATYGLATVGAFGVLAVLEAHGASQQLTDLAGLWKRSPLLSACLLVFVLSLAGIPPLGGFFGKVFVFSAAFRAGHWTGGLAGLALVFSAVGFYYYLRILKAVLVAPPERDAPALRPSPAALVTLAAAAALLIALGVWPNVVLRGF